MNRIRTIATALLLGLSATAVSMPANAAPCRDAHGRFTACTGAAAAKANPTKPAKVASRAATTPRTAKPVKVASRTTKPATTVAHKTGTAPAHKTAG